MQIDDLRRTFFANDVPARVSHALARGIWLLAIGIGLLATSNAAPAQARPSSAPTESVTLNVPSQVMIGQDFSFTATFANTSSSTGYGPIIGLILPTNGADGNGNTSLPLDGITFLSATYLGAPVTASAQVFPGSGITPTMVTDPYTYDSNGQPLPVYGTPGDTYVSLQLPFGSFTPGQPLATITINAHLSNYANAGAPLTIRARGGYEYGATPLNDWCCGDPTIVSPTTNDGAGWPSASTTPTVMTVTKSNNAPESETATGPNFPRQYALAVNIAPGQTITSFHFIDTLPNNVQYQGGLTSAPAFVAATEPITTAPQNPPASTLDLSIPSVTNSASAGFTFFIPISDANQTYVVDPTTGACSTSTNPLMVSGTWTPLDPRDAPTVVTATLAPGNTLSDCALVVQKGVTDVTNPSAPTPLDSVAYTLTFQISDYFAFQDINLQDFLPDGIHFDSTFTPTLTITSHGSASSGAMSAANYPITDHWTGAPSPVAPINGTTEINFHVSDELVSRALSPQVLGGCVPNSGTGGADPNCSAYNGGPATGTIVFRGKIQTNYTDIYPSNRSVYPGDTLNNTVAITGTVLNTGNLTPTGNSATNPSSASVTIASPALTKSVYAINGTICDPCASPRVMPGDNVTYRFTYHLPSAFFYNQTFVDYLPLPIYDATTIVAPFDTTITSTVPIAGHAHFGPAETLFPVTGITPTITTSASSNSVTFGYGSFTDTQSRALTTDVLFTVVVKDNPFADGLYLTNQVQAVQDNHTAQVANAIVQVQLGEPLLTSTKSVIASSNPHAVFSPATVGPVTFNAPGTSGARWSGVINSSNLITNPIQSNVSGVDAYDTLSFALVIQNSGTSAKGAFDIIISDTLPTGFITPTGGLNLRISYGDGSGPISYTRPDGTAASPSDLFGAGIKLTDPSSTQGVCQQHSLTNGLNIVIVTYDLEVASAIPANTPLTNTGALVHYAGDSGGPNFLSAPQPMTSTVTTAPPLLAKTIAATGLPNSPDTNVAVGELVTYSATITVPEGVTGSTVLTDTLTPGLAFVTNTVASSLSSGLSISGSTTPTIAPDGSTAIFNLGDLTNSNNNAPISATLTLTYPVVVLNTAVNTRGVTQTNGITMTYAGGSATATAPPLTIVEPTLTLNKTASPTAGDAADPITYTLGITNGGASNANAYDVVLTDTIPAGMFFVTSTVASGIAPNSLVQSGGVITATWNTFTLTQSSALQFVAALGPTTQPSQAISNTAHLAWTSLPGDATTPQSAYVISSTERTGDMSNPGGALNDYYAASAATITTTAPTIGKTIVATSLPNTTGANVAIGEIVTYSLAITVPEGVTSNAVVTDTLPSGLAILTNTISSTLSAPLSITGAVTPTVGSNGGNAVFNLGAITNTDTNNATPEIIRIDYPVVVLNASGNTRNATRANSVRMTYNGGALGPVSAPSVKIVEPTLSVTKTASPTTGDAGNVITYTLAVTHTAASNSDAFDVVLTDTIPSDLTFTGYLTNTTGVAPASLVQSGGVITATWNTLSLTQGSQFQFAGTLDYSVAPAQVITNTANLAWTSLPGDVTTPQSPYNALSTERTGNTSNPGGALNTYVATGNAPVTVTNVAPTKYLVATSETTTPISTSVSIGEVVRYRLAAQLPEGTSNNFTITDLLPNGMEFLNDGTAKVAFVANGAGIASSTITTTLLGCANLNFTGNAADLVSLPSSQITCPLPTSAISPTIFSSGADPVFSLGNLVNSDNDPDAEYVVVELNAVVMNVAGNQSGTALVNSFRAAINGTTLTTSTPVTITVAEPAFTPVKRVTVTPTDAGDTVVYTLAYSNTATGAARATAYSVALTDTLDSHLSLVGVSAVAPAGSIVTDTSTLGSGGSVNVLVDPLPPAVDLSGVNGVTLTITATVAPGAFAAQTIPNSANLTFVSLPGGTGTISNPTGSSTPGAPGTSTGARTGSGGVNDDAASSNPANVTLAAPTIDKLAPTPTQYTIGDVITYNICVDLPEGDTRNLIVTDTLPAYLAYVPGSGQVLTDTTSVQACNPAYTAYNGTLTGATVVSSGQNIGLSFAADPQTIADNNADNNAFIYQLQALVQNVIQNQDGATRTNNASLTYTNPNDGSTATVTSPSRNITIIEPTLAINKSISGAPSPADAGGWVTYTVNISHAVNSHSPAYNVVFSDTIPAGLTSASVVGVSASGIAAPSAQITGTVLGTGAFDLPLGASVTVTYQAQIDSAVTPSQTITNTGDVVWTSQPGANVNGRSSGDSLLGAGGLNDYAVQSSAPFTINDATIGKSIAATSLADTPGSNVTIGEILTYSLAITLPEGTTPSLAVTDTLPTGLTYLAGTAITDTTGFNGSLSAMGTTTASNQVVFTFASPITVVADNDPTNNTFHVLFQARVADVVGNQIGVTLPNSASLQTGGATASSNTATATVVVPQWNIVKTFTPSSASPNDPVTITLAVTNTGTSAAYNVVVSDPLANAQLTNVTPLVTPGGYTYSATPLGGSTRVQYTGGTLAIGSGATFTFSATLASGLTGGTIINNTATVTGTTLPGSDANARSVTANGSANLTVTAPALSIVKSDGGATVSPGGAIAYTLTYSNTGNSGATGVTITDTVPANTTFNASASSVGWSCAPNNSAGSVCSYAIGTLAGNSGASTAFFGVIANNPLPVGTTQITNTAYLSDDSGHRASGSDTTPITGAQPDLAITKSHSGANATANSIVTYTLQYTNSGTIGASNVLITETVPASTTFAGPAGTWNCNVGDGAGTPCVRNIGVLGGGSGSVSFIVRVNSSLPITTTALANTVRIGDDGVNGPDANPANNIYTDTMPVAGLTPVLSITKSANVVVVNPGGVITYTLLYTNTGSTDATGVALTETVPANTTFTGIGWSCAPNSNAGSACTRAVGTLTGAGGAGSAQFVVTVASSLSGVTQIANSVTIADGSAHSATATVSTPAQPPISYLYLPYISLLPNAPPPTPTNTPTPVPPRPMVDPKGMVSDAARDHLYLVSNGDNTVTVFQESTINTANPTWLAKIAVGVQPFGIGMVDDKIYVANSGGKGPSSVSVISAATMTKLYDIPLQSCGGDAAQLAVNPLTHRVYTTLHASAKVAVINSTTDSLVGCVTTNAGAFGIAVHPASNSIFVGNRDGLDLWRIDGATNIATQVVNWRSGSGGSPYYVGIDLTTNLLFAMVGLPNSSVPNKLYVYSVDNAGGLSNPRVAAVGNTDDGGFVLQSQCSSLIFIAETADNDVRILNPDLSLYGIVTQSSGLVDYGPYGLLENPTLKRVYVSNKPSNTLKILNECPGPLAPARASPTATPSATPTPLPAPSTTPTLALSATIAPSKTPPPSETRTPSPAPSWTSTPAPSKTPTPTPLPKPTNTATKTIAPSSTPTISATPTLTATVAITTTK